MSTIDAPARDEDIGGPPEDNSVDVEETALDEPRGVWLTWRQIAALVPAVGFLGGAVMY